jgi:cell division protease FtsH
LRARRHTGIARIVLVKWSAWLRRYALWLAVTVGRPLGRAWRVLQPPPGQFRQDELLTRKPLAVWDRVKFLLLFTLLWFILVWSVMASDPIIGFRDALATEVQTGWWVFVLFALELLRQIHYVISEHSVGYHRFWTYHFFGGVERASQRNLAPWTRFRLKRVLLWVFWIAVIAVIAGKVTHTNALDALAQMPRYIWDALPFVLQIVVILLFVVAQFAMLFWFLSRGGVDVYYPDDVEARFSDVWGQDRVLERVRENILYLENPELIESRGGYVPGGILLWGPPGTGKTLMAEAVAGETGKPYVFVDPGAFINMFMGVGILKVKSLFRKLRKLALRYGGVIVFFDEADSLGRRGALAQGGPNFPRASAESAAWQTAGCNGFSYLSSDSQWRLAQRTLASSADDDPGVRRHKQMMGMGMNGGGMGTLQALLSELSGLTKPRGLINRYGRRLLGMRPKPPPKYRILVMMATNLPEALDEALLRPGRIDRIYKVGYPSKAGRVRTYQGYFAKVRHQLSLDEIDKLAVITPYATGATIKDLVNESLIMAIRNGRDVITWPDVMKAKQLKELGPPDDVEYIERERHAVAVHEACHAIVAHRTRRHTQIDIATIEKASDYLGMVTRIPPEEQFTHWRSEYESDILCSLASLAGERMFFDNDSSSGVSGDLESATAVASFMEGYWGMGSTVSSYSTAKRLEVGAPGGGQGGRNRKGQDTELELRRALADRIEDSLGGLLTRARQILRENRAEVLSLAHALEMHKTLSGDDVVAVIERQQGPIVDGTIYADADFMQEIEDYHRGAAAAHREHDKLLLTLPEPPRSALTVPAVPAWYAVQDGERSGDHWNGGPAAAPGPAVGLAAPAVPAGQGNGSARPVPYQSRWLVTQGAPEEEPAADRVPSGDGVASGDGAASGDGVAPADGVASGDGVAPADELVPAEAEPPAQTGSPVEATPSDEAGPAQDDGPSGEQGPASTT